MKQGNSAEAKYGNGVWSGHIILQIKAPSIMASLTHKAKAAFKNGRK